MGKIFSGGYENASCISVYIYKYEIYVYEYYHFS